LKKDKVIEENEEKIIGIIENDGNGLNVSNDDERNGIEDDVIDKENDLGNFNMKFQGTDQNIDTNFSSRYNSSGFVEIPLFTIYYMEINDVVNEQISNCRKYLISKVDVNENDIVNVNISNDYELIGYITEQCGGVLTLPIVMCKRTYIGGYETLKQLHIKGEIQVLISNDEPQLHDEEQSGKDVPQLGVISKAIESVDHLLSTLNPLNYFSWGKKDTDLSNMEIFEVVHTNWYNRSQIRKFHFGEKVLMRVNPYKNDIRAVQNYNDIESVTRRDKNNIIIKYKTGASSDYIKASVKDIDRMIELLNTKTKLLSQ